MGIICSVDKNVVLVCVCGEKVAKCVVVRDLCIWLCTLT